MSNPSAKQTAADRGQRRKQEGIRETLESIVIALIFAFVFRAFVVEAFVIPTGSMAPTLLGAHVAIQCEQCGYDYAADVPDHSAQTQTGHRATVALRQDTRATCPMCRYPNILRRGSEPSAGDRILVQKYLYSFVDPGRWDVAVFKAPHQPEINFIKRLIGRPGEALALLDGNVYVHDLQPGENLPEQPLDSPGWRIARKGDHPDVQRAVWQPIYHSQYVPLDSGSPGMTLGGQRRETWEIPWRAQGETADHWDLEGRSYEYDSAEPGRLAFNFTAGRHAHAEALYPYNQFKPALGREPIEDIRLGVRLQPENAGMSVRLGTTARVPLAGHPQRDRGPDRLEAHFEPDRLRLAAVDQQGRTYELASTPFAGLPAGRASEIELWYVDQQASLWINNRRKLNANLDVPLRDVIDRGRPRPLPEPTVHVAGSPVRLHRVELDRDLYYSSEHQARSQPGIGALVRRGDEGRIDGRPVVLGPDEFFTVGDNGPFSDDSRFWGDAHPWVRDRMADGRERPGIVPRDLIMGRAFFVYWPGPLGWRDDSTRLIPNFGDMRLIR